MDKLVNSKKPKVAFLCTHNSCRSQMTEAIAKIKYSEKIESYSAGTEIKEHINPDAIRLIKEKYGFDMEKEGQKNKTVFDIPPIDIAILMGCDIVCPSIKSEYSENWNLDDPTGKGDEVFLETISEIEMKLKELVDKI